MAKSFEDLANRTMSAASRARATRRTRAILVEMLLAEVRKLAGKSQSELARILGIKQPTLSKLEGQEDMQISTLQRIIEALGGEVEIIARFPKASVRLRQFQKNAVSKAVARTPSPKRIREVQELQLV